MEIISQVLVGIAGLLLLGLGSMAMFAPKKMLKEFSIEPLGTHGLNTIRAQIGGLFLGAVAMAILGYTQGQTLWYLAVGIVVGAVAIGRVVGLLFDGFDKAVIIRLVVEIVIVAIFVAAYMQVGVS